MKTRSIALFLTAAMLAASISGCGNTSKAPSSAFEKMTASLHAGQSYTYAPICEGKDALLVTSYTFDDLEGHLASYEATLYIDKNGSIEKVTTVQSGGTAYPIALTDDNSLILSMRNSIQKAHIDKETGKYVITEESNVQYTASDEESYHNYTDGTVELTTDSGMYDKLYEEYLSSKVLSFKSAGVSSKGTPRLAGAVYAAYNGEDLYKPGTYMMFDSETSGRTQSPDGLTGLPFEYEQNADQIIFHFASADDTSPAQWSWNNGSFPTLTFTDGSILDSDLVTLTCLGNADPETFDAVTYYDNDNNLLMHVKDFDETTLTGDLYREERLEKEDVEKAEIGNYLYSVNGTQFTTVSFEEVNKELAYGTDEEFKKDVVGDGTIRYDRFLVKCGDDDFYYALEKEDYAEEYRVVSMMTDEKLRKLIEENVTYPIRENCEIILLKYVENDVASHIVEEHIIGREFKGDHYPDWSENPDEYYTTNDMLTSISVVDGEIYNIVQVYVP